MSDEADDALSVMLGNGISETVSDTYLKNGNRKYGYVKLKHELFFFVTVFS